MCKCNALVIVLYLHSRVLHVYCTFSLKKFLGPDSLKLKVYLVTFLSHHFCCICKVIHYLIHWRVSRVILDFLHSIFFFLHRIVNHWSPCPSCHHEIRPTDLIAFSNNIFILCLNFLIQTFRLFCRNRDADSYPGFKCSDYWEIGVGVLFCLF